MWKIEFRIPLLSEYFVFGIIFHVGASPYIGMVAALLFLFICSVMSNLWSPMDSNMPGLPVLHHLLELAQTHVSWIGDSIQPSHPLSSPSPPAFRRSTWVFSNKSVLCIRWPKYWSISPSNEYSGLISFRIDWFDFLAVQGTLQVFSTPQFKGISSSVLSLLYGSTLASIHDYWEK